MLTPTAGPGTRVLVGTEDGVAEVGGGDFRAIALAGRSVTALTRGDGCWWAVVDAGELWHTASDHGHWQRRAQATNPEARCLLPIAQGLLVGTAEAGLARLSVEADDNGVPDAVEGFARVEGRERWYTPWGGPPDTRWLSAADAGTYFANIHVGGIVASTDDGRSWRPTTLDIHADVHQVLAGAAPDLVLAPCAKGLAVSPDRGQTWRIDDDGLHATYSRAVAVAGDTVLISASTGPRTERSALYRRPLGSTGRFGRCRQGLPEWFITNVDTGCLVADGSTVACATGDGAVFVSTDQGGTWEEMAEGLPPVHCLALSV